MALEGNQPCYKTRSTYMHIYPSLEWKRFGRGSETVVLQRSDLAIDKILLHDPRLGGTITTGGSAHRETREENKIRSGLTSCPRVSFTLDLDSISASRRRVGEKSHPGARLTERESDT